jgi:hypothetical protein
MKRFIAAALAAGCLLSCTPVFSADADADADAGAFDKWLSPDAPECVPVSGIRSVATLTDLTPEQFQFVRQSRENCLRAIMRSWQAQAAP